MGLGPCWRDSDLGSVEKEEEDTFAHTNNNVAPLINAINAY